VTFALAQALCCVLEWRSDMQSVLYKEHFCSSVCR